jgi:hypothetical protein
LLTNAGVNSNPIPTPRRETRNSFPFVSVYLLFCCVFSFSFFMFCLNVLIRLYYRKWYNNECVYNLFFKFIIFPPMLYPGKHHEYIPQDGVVPFQLPSTWHVTLVLPFSDEPSSHLKPAVVAVPLDVKSIPPPLGAAKSLHLTVTRTNEHLILEYVEFIISHNTLLIWYANKFIIVWLYKDIYLLKITLITI